MAQTENPAANGADRDLPTHAVPASELPPSVALHKADMTVLGLLSFSAKSLEIVPFKNASENTAASGADTEEQGCRWHRQRNNDSSI
jgi:hypothetical protein